MKHGKYSAIAAFFGLGVAAYLGRKRERAPKQELEANKVARLSAATGVSVESLSLFSRISEHKEFTADDAHRDFGAIRRKEVA